MRLVLLILIGAALFWGYRSCTSGYQEYAYFVLVSDPQVFDRPLDDRDNRIVNHGRKLITDISAKDQAIDGGDGPQDGQLRWYRCSGIDCDEGWQNSFTK